MSSRDRFLTALKGGKPDRVPLFLFGLDPRLSKIMAGGDTLEAYDRLGVDAFPIRVTYYCQDMPSAASLTMDIPEEEASGSGIFAGWNGVDEFGRVWSHGGYIGGALKTWDDLEKYVPHENWEQRTPPDVFKKAKDQYPDKAFGAHVHLGPFGTTMESMGFEDFCLGLYTNRDLVEETIRRRTEWITKCFSYIESLGADYIVLGDDAAYKGSTFVSPKDFDELAVPNFSRIVASVNIPVIWHSDGYVEGLVDKAIEIGFKGFHPIDPSSGNGLARIRKAYGHQIALIGNVDALNVLTNNDLKAVRDEVDRCMHQAKANGGYMLATSNSAHFDCDPGAVCEMYRYGAEVGWY